MPLALQVAHSVRYLHLHTIQGLNMRLTFAGILTSWLIPQVTLATTQTAECFTPSGTFAATCSEPTLYNCYVKDSDFLAVCKFTTNCQPNNPNLAKHPNALFFLPRTQLTEIRNIDGELKPDSLFMQHLPLDCKAVVNAQAKPQL